MAWMQSEADLKRAAGLRQLEEMRVNWAANVQAGGTTFEQALLTQVGGGFEGIALTKSGRLYYLAGPAPGDPEGQFACEHIAHPQCNFEPYVIEPEGFGGVLGVGKKGGMGYKLFINGDNLEKTLEYMPALHGMMDVPEGAPFPLFELVLNKKEYNFVWEFASPDRTQLETIVLRWAKLLTKLA